MSDSDELLKGPVWLKSVFVFPGAVPAGAGALSSHEVDSFAVAVSAVGCIHEYGYGCA